MLLLRMCTGMRPLSRVRLFVRMRLSAMLAIALLCVWTYTARLLYDLASLVSLVCVAQWRYVGPGKFVQPRAERHPQIVDSAGTGMPQ